nr:hypothetical protein [uncultured Noviherbaspirillum sp.]
MKENTAAAVMLMTPAMVVASSIESSVELILDLGAKGAELKHSRPGLGKPRRL